MPRHVVVMGVSGSGKTTVAAELARRTGATFAEGDDFHPPENVAKMSAGTPLDDEDRWPWLEALAAWTAEQDGPTVLTCSALKRSYRDVLRAADPATYFLHVHADPEVLHRRVEARRGHYMPPSLLQSQLDTLEPLEEDERGEVVDVSGTPEETVAAVEAALARADA